MLLTVQKEIKGRWMVYFRDMFSRIIMVGDIGKKLFVNHLRRELMDLIRGLQQLKCGKAAAPNGIMGEIFKTSIEEITEILWKLFNNMWREENIPKELTEGIRI